VRAGFADPVFESQRVFRGVLDAMAEPGRVITLQAPPSSPGLLHSATVAIALALLDFETPVWLDGAAETAETVAHLRFHCGCPIVDEPARARFAIIANPGEMPEIGGFDAGTDEYPDRSATLIVQTGGLVARSGLRLSGPGIATEARLQVNGLPSRFWEALRGNHARFPRGVDVLLTAGPSLVALPRTTWVEG
jgi:alpha-D-ribose 1-methylphosphonate 5-triphosphate synthase subunit PhnH